MPNYTFCIEEAGNAPHKVEIHLRDVNAAKREALRTASGFLLDSGSNVWSGERWTLRVSEAGSEILNLCFLAVEPA